MKSAIVIQTDFGVENLSVSTMYGVCYTVSPELKVFNATHAVPKFDVLAASDALVYNIPFWPEGTVFVSVVDPGVGTKRCSCVAKLRTGHYVVTPDNGTLTYVKKQFGIDSVREIDETINRYPTTRDIHIFHGRDVYAYCAARLAANVIMFEEVGPEYPTSQIVMAPYTEPSSENGALSGMINEATEHFGLLGTNIPFKWLAECGMEYGSKVRAAITFKSSPVFDEVIRLEKSFGYVSEGQKVMLSSETGTVMLAINKGNLVKDYKLGYGPDWKITLTRS